MKQFILTAMLAFVGLSANAQTPGSLDLSFSVDGIQTTDVGLSDDRGYSVAIQADGKIVMAGVSHNGTNNDFALTRYNSDGTLDVTFSGDGIQTTAVGSRHDAGFSVAIQADGKIVVAGDSYNGANRDFALTRYNSDGSLDVTFSGDGIQTTDVGSGDDYGYSVAIQADGKIVVAGISHNGTNDDFALTRYNSDGTLDVTFSGDGIQTTAIGSGSDAGYSVAIQADGKIVVAGSSYNGTNTDIALTRYNSDGNLDITFSGDGIQTTDVGGGRDIGRSVAIQADGKIVVAGSSGYGANDDIALTRYNSDGTLDSTFSGDGIQTTDVGGGVDIGYSVAIQADGKIVVAGFSNNGANEDFALTRYNSDGTLDISFSGDGILTTAIGSGRDYGFSVAIQADGKIVVAGASNNGANLDFALTRYIGGSTTSITQMLSSNRDVLISPNPFSTQTTLQTAEVLENATLTVYNLYGQTVKQIEDISGQTVTLHRSNLPSGLYFIRLTEKNRIITVEKLVITD